MKMSIFFDIVSSFIVCKILEGRLDVFLVSEVVVDCVLADELSLDLLSPHPLNNSAPHAIPIINAVEIFFSFKTSPSLKINFD